MKLDSFVSGTDLRASSNFDASRCRNMFVETGSEFTKGRACLLGSPGLAIFTDLGAGPVRGMFPVEKRLFAVAAAHLWEIFYDGSANDRGLVAYDTFPVDMMANNGQVAVVGGGFFMADNGGGPVQPSFPAYTGFVNLVDDEIAWVSGDEFDKGMVGSPISVGIYNTSVAEVLDPQPNGTYHLIVLASSTGATLPNQPYSATPLVTASSGCYIDGYFVVSRPGTAQFNISALLDATTWDPLDYATKEAYPDLIVRVFADHEDLWIFGSQQSTEVWQNTGAANFPFQRIPGDFIHYGLAAKDSVARLNNGIAWIAIDVERGGPIAVYAQGFVPVRVSSYAVEQAWAAYSTVADAVAFPFIDRGHHMWQISFPEANATWVYDATTNQWHERSFTNGASQDRHRAWCNAYTALDDPMDDFSLPRQFVGDWENGHVYNMSAALLTDAGTVIERMRVVPYVSDGANLNRVFHHRFQLDTEVRDDAMTLDWSDDGGHTFKASHTPSMTTTATWGARTLWNRLGQSRARAYRVKSRAAIVQAWIGAYLELTGGLN